MGKGEVDSASTASGTTRRRHVDLLVERIPRYLFSDPGGKHDLLTFLSLSDERTLRRGPKGPRGGCKLLVGWCL